VRGHQIRAKSDCVFEMACCGTVFAFPALKLPAQKFKIGIVWVSLRQPSDSRLGFRQSTGIDQRMNLQNRSGGCHRGAAGGKR